jgi:hypothetical protein
MPGRSDCVTIRLHNCRAEKGTIHTQLDHHDGTKHDA